MPKGRCAILIIILFFGVLIHINNSSADTIKFGVVGPQSGDLSPYGITALRAAEIIVNKVNSDGGILGKTVELIDRDDYCSPTIAAEIASQLISQNATMVLGHICSGATMAALEIYKNAEIVIMSPASTNPDLTRSGNYPNFFRTIAPDDDQARVQVYYALNILKLNKFAVVHDNTPYGSGIAELSNDSLVADPRSTVVLYTSITPGLSDYSTIAQEINESKAECLIYGGYGPEASKILSQLRQLNENVVFISDDGVKDTIIEQAGISSEGAYITAPKDPSNNLLYKQAVTEYQEAYGENPGPFFAEAYAGTLVLFDAIEKTGDLYNFDQIYASLRNNPVNTPLGKIRFDEKGDAIGVSFSVYKVVDGTFVEVYSEILPYNNPAIPLLLLTD